MAENQSSLTFEGIEIAAAKDRLWHVEAAGKSAATRFLDQALEKVVPHLTNRQRDALMLKLLMLVHFRHD
jgi:chemotaxis regulatin CheY-phosphate phosphatase CheZ